MFDPGLGCCWFNIGECYDSGGNADSPQSSFVCDTVELLLSTEEGGQVRRISI